MRQIHITNAAGRDTTVAFDTMKPPPTPRRGVPGREVRFKRYVAEPETGRHEVLVEELGEDYGRKLVDGDPEVDMEIIGREIQRTDRVYLSSRGEVLYAPPQLVDVILDTTGRERERREAEEVQANVADEQPVRWTGMKIDKRDAVRRFAFGRTVQLHHVDGLTYDYLYGMARELADEGVMVRLGGGPRGREPLRFVANGSPYQGFLEGRVDGERYMLLLHLSNMELKRPAPPEEAG